MRIRRVLALVGSAVLVAGGLALSSGPAAAATTFTVNSLADVAGSCPVTCTLRAAITAANATAGNDVIQFSVNGTITLDHLLGELVVNDASGGSLTIAGNGTANTIIDGNDGVTAVRVLHVTGANALVLQNLTIQNGADAAAGGGAVFSGGTVTTTNADFSGNNSSNGQGGAISAGTVTVVGGKFDSNSALRGGALDVGVGNISGNAKFTRNHVTGNRGGAVSFSSTLQVDNSTFGGVPASQGNTSTVDGGAISTLTGTSLVLTRTIVINNSAGVNGGGIYFGGTGTATISNSAILSNTATAGSGGGIEMDGVTASVDSQTLDVNRSVLQANVSTVGAGGAIGLDVNSQGALNATITNNTFQGNTAGRAGGIVNLTDPDIGSANVTLRNNTITQNGSLAGSAASNSNGTMTLIANIISANNGPACAGTMTDGGSNLLFADVGGSTCPTGGTNITGQNPLLGTLQVNPPGFTATMALLPGSPAIDRVAGGCPPPGTDQRGVTRPQGPACDIGAYEVEVPIARFTG